MGNVTATARYVQSAPQRTAIATRSRAKAAVARAAEEALLTDLPFLPEIILYFFENIVPDSCFFQMFCIARELNVAMRNFCDHNDSMTRLFVLRIPLWCHDMLSVMSTQCWLRHTSAPGYENRAITVEPRGWIAESSKVSIEALRWLEALRLKMTTVIRSIGACALIGVQVGLFDVLQEIATSRLFGLAKYAMNTPTAIIDQHVMDAVELREMFAIKGSVVYSVMIATVLPTASLQVFRRLVAQLASTDILRVLHWHIVMFSTSHISGLISPDALKARVDCFLERPRNGTATDTRDLIRAASAPTLFGSVADVCDFVLFVAHKLGFTREILLERAAEVLPRDCWANIAILRHFGITSLDQEKGGHAYALCHAAFGDIGWQHHQQQQQEDDGDEPPAKRVC